MAQFDVYELPGGSWGVDVQSDMIGVADTVVVVPLVVPDPTLKTIRRLNPELVIDGERRVFMAQLLTAVRRPPPSKCIASLAAQEYEIKGALDLLVSGI